MSVAQQECMNMTVDAWRMMPHQCTVKQRGWSKRTAYTDIRKDSARPGTGTKNLPRHNVIIRYVLPAPAPRRPFRPPPSAMHLYRCTAPYSRPAPPPAPARPPPATAAPAPHFPGKIRPAACAPHAPYPYLPPAPAPPAPPAPPVSLAFRAPPPPPRMPQ